MEKQKPAPGSHSELHDPKLPVINGAGTPTHIRPGTVPPVIPPMTPEG